MFRFILEGFLASRGPVVRLLVTGALAGIFLFAALETLAAIGIVVPPGWPIALIAGVCGGLSYWLAHTLPAPRRR